ncbi:MAG: PKD domain-containing protein [Cryomorphaceae bacterium]|nr:PKD domain-containing protein [Cryomorphaceae bacterium]
MESTVKKSRKFFKTISALAFLIIVVSKLSGQATFEVPSSHGYTVHVTLLPTSVQATTSCANGYNYQVDLDYTISFSGTNIPASLWVMQGYVGCDAGSHFFQLPETAGSGTTTSGTGFSYHCNCEQSTPDLIGCNTLQLLISGPGILYQTISQDYSYETPANNTAKWLGTVNSSWSNPLNWDESVVPYSGSDILVSSEAQNPMMISQNICIKDLILEAGSSASIADNSINVRLTGDIISDGEFNPLKGKISLEGGTPQLIGGTSLTTFHNLRINSYSTVTLNSDISISGFLQPDRGTFDMNGHKLRIYSDADFTGAIGQIKSTCVFIGDSLEYHRFFPAGSGNWRMLSSPLNDATYEQWNDDIPTTGFLGADYPNYPNASNPWSNIRTYDGENLNETMSQTFESIENITDSIPLGDGHFVYFIPSETTIDMTGTFLKGNHTWIRSNGSPTLNQNNGWHMLGNPYPCPIDWDKSSGWSKNDISNAVYAFDPTTGQYSSYVNGVSTGRMNGKIESFQAFWVKTNGTGMNVTVNENAKATSAGVMLRSTDANTESLVRVILNNQNNVPIDDCVVGFNYLASEFFDENLDALKLFANDTNVPNIAIYPDTLTSQSMSISTFPVPVDETVINLMIKAGNQTTFSIENGMIDSFEDNFCLKLLDRETDQLYAFNLGEKYEFSVGEIDLRYRFALVVGAPMDVIVMGETCQGDDNAKITAQGYGEAPWTFEWADEMGNIIKTTENAYEADKLENLSPGFYTIEVSNNNELCNSAIEVVQVEAAQLPDIVSTCTPENCNTLGNGSIALNINDDFSYYITITNGENNEVIELTNIQSDTLITQLGAGVYSLIADNGCPNQLETQILNLRDPDAVYSNPSAICTSTSIAEGGKISFLNNSSTNCTNFKWEFGDGEVDSTNVSPLHIYNHWGTYNVKLIANNAFCTDTAQMIVQVSGVGNSGSNNSTEAMAAIQEDPQLTNRSMDVKIFSDQLQILSEVAIEGQIVLKINSLTGQLVFDKTMNELPAGATTIDISSLNQGLYTYGIQTEKTILKSGEFAK